MSTATIRHDWTHAEVEALFALPFNELLFQAQTMHRQKFDPNRVQLSTLLSIKTGACQRLSHRQRAATPIPFRDMLLAMARSVR